MCNMVIEDKKQARSQAKGLVTRCMNSIGQILQAEETEGLREQEELLNEKFELFKTAHMDYMQGVDEGDKVTGDVYYNEVAVEVNQIKDKIESMFPPDDPVDHKDSVSKAGSSMTARRIEMAQKRAELRAKQERMQSEFELEELERKIRQKRDMLAVQQELSQMKYEDEEFEKLSDDNKSHISRASKASQRSKLSAKESIVSVSSHQSEILEQQKRLIDVMSAPKVDIQVFDGDSLKYWPFVRAF